MDEKQMQMEQMDALSLEETFQELERVVSQLENADISLEESFQAYENGMRLLKGCNDKIDAVEKKVLVLSEGGNLSDFESGTV